MAPDDKFEITDVDLTSAVGSSPSPSPLEELEEPLLCELSSMPESLSFSAPSGKTSFSLGTVWNGWNDLLYLEITQWCSVLPNYSDTLGNS